ncbi:MAG: DEAD/DEAH box helicase [Alphaproteobacteria bacterium]|nr:DEAD/DEAH box helicase [Alphaproteobacteria bacterium]MBU0797603.1 DEAD/DEAH box helicase [Alphaproteobacteria bacterium]MBU0886609.1 DEAD/DEAH box helicase [Alphaproteobacteria bacterium]MBU1812582.1 DEAD/DEAH box helicase [Alphaproteobacteria bacterium]MBU2090347.1 DEAD/DEAH box helicase [Alphaproteobacteria bacterium]
MSDEPSAVAVRYNADHSGTFAVSPDGLETPIWSRLKLAIRTKKLDHTISGGEIYLSWPDTLGVIRELGSKSNQVSLHFRFLPEGVAADKLRAFASQIKKTRAQRTALTAELSPKEIEERLLELGFTKRALKPFQLRDVARLLALGNGANFSVPGAGKTTVTFALHMLTRKPGQHFMVVAPKAAFQAWSDIVAECMEEDAPDGGSEPFTLLTGPEEQTREALHSGATRFVISYDMVIRQQGLLATHFATTETHLVLDEAHRMKAGWNSQRGAFLLRVADDPVRRDILTGTPMPQAASDIESQLDFLWPGHGYGLEISHGKSPRDVLGNLYVRTTKQELGLPKAERHFIDVSMDDGQLALYSIVRNEFLRNYSKQVSHGMGDAQFLKARKSVMRLLQLSMNPVLALSAMANDDVKINSGIVDLVLEEGHSSKMRAVMDHAYALARQGQKSVIWTIFTDTIHSFASSLADLNPVFIHGGVPSGLANDPASREGRIRRFHEDSGCFVLIANPAAAGEGISLHTVCHNAIYADRSYVSTHYLQSIDRIHRLGLPPDQETHIHVYRSKAPPVIGSIDMSVSRRLVEKIRNMQMLLNDPDLHEIAFDEEEAADPIDYDIELQDIIDLISELEGSAADVPLEDE